MSLLDVRDLFVHFPTREGVVRAVDGVSLDIAPGETWCLLGESGCGKSVVALSLLRLLPGSARVRGAIRFENHDVLSIREKEMERLRGGGMAMIFEQPAGYLAPAFTVGEQIVEAARAHTSMAHDQAWEWAMHLLEEVRIPEPAKRARQYPHELSGGMQQRVMIAIALARKPRLLIADEPTTSLDLVMQAQIIELLHETVSRGKCALLLITHDCDVARTLCANTAVMYAGQLLETGTTDAVFTSPRHPYTQALFGALSGSEPHPIPGSAPSMINYPQGCRFQPRCSKSLEQCLHQPPDIREGCRCHLA
ncbi:dipeptide ABC transporter ATP-binding protein DppD [Desulfonatronum sp. SC1]|nr:dipeptide ABC transporter ATP-binding protein DppD [Desulfonatronum sp. SC1]